MLKQEHKKESRTANQPRWGSDTQLKDTSMLTQTTKGFN